MEKYKKTHICHSERSEESYKINQLKKEILRLTPQNDIATQSVAAGSFNLKSAISN